MRKSKFIIILIISVFILNSVGAKQKTKYPFSAIPKEFLTGANVVVREFGISFKIESSSETKTIYNYAVTILNENGDDEALLYVFYDKGIKIAYLRGWRYNALGQLDAKLSGDEIEDQSAISGYSLYEDSRVKIADLSCNTYPYTVVFEYEIKTANTLFYPTWRPVQRERASVVHASFTIEFPENINVRYKEINLTEKVLESSENGIKKYYWEVNKLKPFKHEDYGPKLSKLVPVVHTAPSDFTYDGYEGNMESWQNFGKWISLLNEGRDELDEATVVKLKQLTSGIYAKREKVKRIYEYMQENTRYISIQLGIGGYQPFEAMEVVEKGYGDCKALTNYTKAMLKHLGIISYYTLVSAGKNRENVIDDFPSSRFNHAFLCVPVENDTIWLECTSQTCPFGYLGYFTNNRDVLVINETGGHLVHTPNYLKTDNLQYRTADVTIDSDGNAFAKTNTSYSGLQYENDNINYYVNKSSEEQKKWLYNKIDLAGIDITSFHLTNYKERIPEVKETVEFKVPKYATTSGKRLFLQPNFLNKWDGYPEKIEERKTEIIKRVAFTDVDTINYILPKGYNIEYKPTGKHIKSQFGEYKSEITLRDNVVTYIRVLKMEQGTFPAETYDQLRDFYKQIVKADKIKIVFVSAK